MFQKYMIWFCYTNAHMRTHNIPTLIHLTFEKSWTCVCIFWIFVCFGTIVSIILFTVEFIIKSWFSCAHVCAYVTYCKVIIMDGLYMVYTYLNLKSRKKNVFFQCFFWIFVVFLLLLIFSSFKIVIKIITRLQVSAFPF